MPNTHVTTFDPNPMQRQFIESRARADLYSSRMGEGKSTGLSWAAMYHTRHNPGARWALIRDTWENLQATTMKTFFTWFPQGVFGTFHTGKKTFTWAEGVARGEVEFLGMDAPEDASKLMSRELGGFGIDEPAPAVGSAGVEEMIFDFAMTRLRQEGMKWYAAKLAVNNPDEAHWTYRRFVQPGDPEFRYWQPGSPENLANLPATYYQDMRKFLAHRPDLVRRFVDGEFGFQTVGRAVTPQWRDAVHLAVGLVPQRGQELILLWDWGHNPTCIVTQKTPLGAWLILDAVVGDGIGAEELINDSIKPLLAAKYPKFPLLHIGDPQGTQREQTSIYRSAVRFMKKTIGGRWKPGPRGWEERIEPLRAALTRQGLIRVDRQNASAVWQALRGGWHFHVSRTGITSAEAVKDIHSHPGDAMSYGAAVLFPLLKLTRSALDQMKAPAPSSYWEGGATAGGPQAQFGRGQPGLVLPQHGDPLFGLDPTGRR